MDKGAWWTTAHGVAELDMTERLHLDLSKLLESLDIAGWEVPS